MLIFSLYFSIFPSSCPNNSHHPFALPLPSPPLPFPLSSPSLSPLTIIPAPSLHHPCPLSSTSLPPLCIISFPSPDLPSPLSPSSLPLSPPLLSPFSAPPSPFLPLAEGVRGCFTEKAVEFYRGALGCPVVCFFWHCRLFFLALSSVFSGIGYLFLSWQFQGNSIARSLSSFVPAECRLRLLPANPR